MNDNNLDSEVRIWQEKLFARSIRRGGKMKRIMELTGSTANAAGLEISAGDGIISANLRTLGGSWKTAVATKAAADSIGYSHGETIVLIDNGKLPFEDQVFDKVVIVDALKNFSDDYQFLHECHRVLKNDGWVIISETRRIPFSMVALLQRLFNISPIAKGARRNGYKVNELFEKLKDGFDVP
ncbi:methyltransferase domain-containing protein, partial [Pontiella sp.]